MTFEIDQIFADPLNATVFLYASVVMLGACAIAALWLRGWKRPALTGSERPADARI